MGTDRTCVWPGSRMARVVTNYEPSYGRRRAEHDLNMDRVLLIDDDAGLIHEQVRAAFPRPGYDVQVADNGSDGIASVRAAAPDVILLDLRLPDIPGLTVFETIREIDEPGAHRVRDDPRDRRTYPGHL